MKRLPRNFRLRQIPQIIWTNRPDFHAPLTYNLLLTKGQGVATFTRATTATITDYEGLLKTAKSGEARFECARRVENLISSNLTTWNKSQGGTGIVPTVTVSATVNPYDETHPVYTVNLNRGAGNTINDNSSISYSTFTIPSSSIGVSRVAIKGVVGETVAVRTIAGTAYMNITFTGYWQIFSHSETGSISNFSFSDRGTIGSTRNVTFEVAQIQLENVTGQANQNPSEYVNKGVLSAPYHGANVDGVKYFNTYNGNTVVGNGVTEATGAAIPEATLKGVMIEVASSNKYANPATLITQNVTTTVIAHTVSFYGTGTVTFTGTYIGSLVGTGVNNRVSLSFTPTSGTLTSTVTGSCTNGQCEPLPMATSFILNSPRNADVLTFPNAGNVSDTAGTVLMDVTPAFDIPNSSIGGCGNNYLIDFGLANGIIQHVTNTLRRSDGVNLIASPAWLPLRNTTYKIGSRYGYAGQTNWLNGTAGTNGAFDGSINSGANMTIGGYGGSTTYNLGGNIKNLTIYKKALSDAQILDAQKLI